METEIEFIKKIVKEANKISEKYFKVFSKDAEYDLVTSLDLEIEKYLISEIKTNYPEFLVEDAKIRKFIIIEIFSRVFI